MASASSQMIRRYVITASVAAITATGAWYGAGLKSRQEFKQERAAVREATPAEKIEQLESMKAKLLVQRAELQAKIDRLTSQPTNASQETQEQSG